MTARRVAVVGGGLAGLVCARALVANGRTVVVFDKGRSPGGRATSRIQDGRVFDHGAQYFTARTDWLMDKLIAWERAGIVARWQPRGKNSAEPWWVGTPSMGALAGHLAEGLDVRLERVVTRVERGLIALADHEPEPFDDIVVALPAPQAAALVGEHFPILRGASLDPCWAVMLVVAGGENDVDVIESDGPIAWAARESSKPGRSRASQGDSWLLHMSREWTTDHLEAHADAVAARVTELFVAQRAGARVALARAHRWRFARAKKVAPVGCFFDETHRIAVCGDWLESPRLEGAVTSGLAAAARLAL